MNFYQNSPLTPEAKTNKLKYIGILVVIIIIIIMVIIFYRNANQPVSQGTGGDRNAMMIAALKAENPPSITAGQKAGMVAALKAENLPSITAGQKAGMVKAIGAGQ